VLVCRVQGAAGVWQSRTRMHCPGLEKNLPLARKKRVVARNGPWRAPVTSAAAPARAGLPLPDKHEALLAEMLFAQMLRLPAPALKPLAYSALMARPGAGRGLQLGRQSLPAHACLASTLAKGLNAEAVSALAISTAKKYVSSKRRACL